MVKLISIIDKLSKALTMGPAENQSIIWFAKHFYVFI